MANLKFTENLSRSKSAPNFLVLKINYDYDSFKPITKKMLITYKFQ